MSVEKQILVGLIIGPSLGCLGFAGARVYGLGPSIALTLSVFLGACLWSFFNWSER